MSTINEHYTEQAKLYGEDALSTIGERVIRERETTLVLETVRRLMPSTILDVGCGNGYTLRQIGRAFPSIDLFGVEPNEELRELAQRCGYIYAGDVTRLGLGPDFQLVLSQRCLINLPDWPTQQKAIGELKRAVSPGRHLLFVECFDSGLAAINAARAEFELEPLSPAWHNVYLPDGLFDAEMANWTEEHVNRHFLSTHSYVSRVLFTMLAKQTPRNARFVEFMCDALPNRGEYSRIQARLFRKHA